MSDNPENPVSSQSSSPSWRTLTTASLFKFIVHGGIRRWTIGILSLALAALALMPLVRGLAFQVLVVPILYFLWLLRLLLEGIPQLFFWVLAVVFFIRIVYPSLWSGKPSSPPRQILIGRPPEGRVAIWLRRLTLGGAGHYSKWALASHMAMLATNTLSYQSRITLREVRERLQNGEYNLSPEAAAYLQSGMLSRPLSRPTRWTRLLQRLGLRKSRDRQPTLADLEPLLQFLEDEMEVGHDIENP